ncbi:uncharacterized protein LOC134682988 [Mytilus trossulus]|uniref:uncharacterized protein LOC134682988 n=1 Tax=Mytilus trossulus TaxID=6551 RepID=UPI0030046AF4
MAALNQESDRFKRAEILIEIGTDALQKKIDEWLPPIILQRKLKENKDNISQIANRQQLAILYNTYDPLSSKSMDLTLMVLVLRNTGLKQPHTSSFDKLPKEHEVSDGADVARLKFYRNELAHSRIKELNEQKFAEISRTIKKVIQRFGGSQFDDRITRIMKESLDYRAKRITWHVRETMVLLPAAINEFVLQLNNQQQLHYSIAIGGGILLVYIKQYSSREELTTYLFHVQNPTVKQCIFILNKLAELNLRQTKQDNSRNDITPGILRTDGHATFPCSHSTLNSDLPEICLPSGNDKKASKYLSRPIPMGDDGLRINSRFYRCQKQGYDSCSNQHISTHRVSNTKIKSCKPQYLSYSQSSSTFPDSIKPLADKYLEYTELTLICPINQTNNHLNVNASNVSLLGSNENVDDCKQPSEYDHLIRKKHDEQHEFWDLEMDIFWALNFMILNLAMVVAMKIIYPIFKGIFNSHVPAKFATFIFVLVCWVLMILSIKK